MRQRRHIFDHDHLDTIIGQRPDSAFPARTRPFHINIYLLQARIERRLGSIGRGHLRGIGRVLLEPLNPILPALLQEMTWPFLLVRLIMMLLKLAVIWASP